MYLSLRPDIYYYIYYVNHTYILGSPLVPIHYGYIMVILWLHYGYTAGPTCLHHHPCLIG